jgi:hypothetical protein
LEETDECQVEEGERHSPASSPVRADESPAEHDRMRFSARTGSVRLSTVFCPTKEPWVRSLGLARGCPPAPVHRKQPFNGSGMPHELIIDISTSIWDRQNAQVDASSA